MDEFKNASINVNINEGSISISGSETFVEKNIEVVFAFVEKSFALSNNKKVTSPVENTSKLEMTNTSTDTTNVDEVEPIDGDPVDKDIYKAHGIYSVDSEDGTISIHRKIPGNNNAEKMKNIALIVLYEKGEPIEGATLKTLCEKQGCWDRKNSSTIFEREYKYFIKKKISSKIWTIALTIDGEHAAKELLEGILNDKK